MTVRPTRKPIVAPATARGLAPILFAPSAEAAKSAAIASAVRGRAPMAYTSDSALAAAIRPQS